MTRYDASTRTDLHAVATVVGELRQRASAHGAGLLVVGAAARDILLAEPAARATNDVDIAVAVASYDAVERVTAGLEKVAGHGNKYRVQGIEVDLVPFGDVERADRTVTSPDGYRMNMLGFVEALATAVAVALPFGVEADVASLPAQVVLKVVAWYDRRHISNKDAIDLRALLVEYAHPRNLPALYDAHFDRVEAHDYDPELAAADRIGAEAAAVLGAAVATFAALVERQCADDGLLPVHMGGDVGRNRSLLQALLRGARGG